MEQQKKARRSVWWGVAAALALVGFAITAAVWNDYQSSSSIANENDYSDTAKYIVTGQLSDTVKRLEEQIATLTQANSELTSKLDVLSKVIDKMDTKSVYINGISTPKRGQVIKAIQFKGSHSYKMTFEIQVRAINRAFVNIFYVGDQLNANPAMWQTPGNRGLLLMQQGFRPGTTQRFTWRFTSNDANTPPLNTWFKVTLEAKNDLITVYYNDVMKTRDNLKVYSLPNPESFFYSSPHYGVATVSLKNLVFQIE